MSPQNLADLLRNPWVIGGAAFVAVATVILLLRRHLGILGRRLKSFGRWILCFSKWIKSFGATYLVVVIVWISGAVFSLSVAYKLLAAPDSSAGNLAWFYQLVQSVLIVVSLAHQGLVFHSLHDLDHNQTLRDSLKGWLDTRTEWLIRVGCVVLLLCVAGEIPHLYREIATAIAGEQPLATSASHPFTASQSHFAVYSVFLFLGLLLWDVGAKRRSASPATQGQTLERDYSKSDALAFAAWLLICIAQSPLTRFWPVLKFLPVLTALILYEYTKEIWKRLRSEIIAPSTKYATGT